MQMIAPSPPPKDRRPFYPYRRKVQATAGARESSGLAASCPQFVIKYTRRQRGDYTSGIPAKSCIERPRHYLTTGESSWHPTEPRPLLLAPISVTRTCILSSPSRTYLVQSLHIATPVPITHLPRPYFIAPIIFSIFEGQFIRPELGSLHVTLVSISWSSCTPYLHSSAEKISKPFPSACL
ncbi:hypothetical protein BDR06DRAFT_1015017 [Suillus hirtellus]|nr:hypothetical protein BDR06DRAFT_1015017 [Suillus hirtellus]